MPFRCAILLGLTLWWGLAFSQSIPPTMGEQCVFPMYGSGETLDAIEACQSYPQCASGSNSPTRWTWCETWTPTEPGGDSGWCSSSACYKTGGTYPCGTAPYTYHEAFQKGQLLLGCDVEVVPECNDPDYPIPVLTEGVITSCAPSPCDGEISSGPTPSAGTVSYFQENGHVCLPNGCKGYPMGTDPDTGDQMYREDSEGGACTGEEPPDATPGGTSPPGGPSQNPGDPGYPPPIVSDEPCSSASPYSQFCAGDPDEDCGPDTGIGSVCEPGCGYYNGQFICQNPDFVGGNCVNVLGDCQVNAPDGDTDEDGEIDIDLTATNQLLQNIRNALQSGEDGGLSGAFDAANTELQGKGEEIGTSIEAQGEDLDDSGIPDFFEMGEEHILLEELESDGADGLVNQWQGRGSGVPSGGACPVFEIGFGEVSEEIDVGAFAPFIQGLLAFAMWFGVATGGGVLFYRMAFP